MMVMLSLYNRNCVIPVQLTIASITIAHQTEISFVTNTYNIILNASILEGYTHFCD